MKREARVAATRARIVEAARKVLVRGDVFGMEGVARAAGVTRVTIYNQLGSKVGLIRAVFEDSGRRMKIGTVLAQLALPDPREALRGLIRESCRAWSRDRAVLQRVVALAAVDRAASRVLAHFEGLRTHDASLLVARLRAEKQLAAGTAAAHVTSAIVALTSFPFYDQLLTTGLSHRAAVDAITRMSATFLGSILRQGA